MKKVYLAGPIFGVQDPASWRKEAIRLLPKGWQAVNPLDLEVSIDRPTHLVQTDLDALARCDAVLVRAEEPSYGTAMELFHASRTLDIPVIAWPCHGERSPWLTVHVSEFFNTLKEAVGALAHV